MVSVELDAFFEGEADGVADLLVRGAEGNALVDEVGSSGHGVEIAGLRGFFHALAIELKRGGEARHEPESICGTNSTEKAGSWVSCMSLL
jgi:hypothetical protein